MFCNMGMPRIVVKNMKLYKQIVMYFHCSLLFAYKHIKAHVLCLLSNN